MSDRWARAAIACGAAAWLLGSTVLPAPAAEIGKCVLYGPKGEFSITPAKPGQLTVETHLPAPAWWNGDRADEIEDGFEYCMAANIAHRLGLEKLEVVDVAWPALVADSSFWDAVVGGQKLPFDLALAEISITDARKQVVDFSVPYFASDIGVLVKAGTEVDGPSLKRLRIGVQAGTTGAGYVADVLQPEQPAQGFGDIVSMLTALQAGRIDAAMTDTAILLASAAQSGGRFKVVGQYGTGEQYGAVYPKNSPNAAILDRVIQALIDDGTLGKLATVYLETVWRVDPATVPYLQP
jgi:polar amino acid transport system substrate-binding protein